VRVEGAGVEAAAEEDERVVRGLRTMVARRIVRIAVVVRRRIRLILAIAGCRYSVSVSPVPAKVGVMAYKGRGWRNEVEVRESSRDMTEVSRDRHMAYAAGSGAYLKTTTPATITFRSIYSISNCPGIVLS
jgi:hypothetical protein